VNQRVRRLAGGRFDYEDLGEQALKGIERPTPAYRIAGVSAAASRFEAATQDGVAPLVGREHEIGLLLDRWAQTQDGESQVVLVCGEPGLGKSRVLNALKAHVETKGARTLGFQCSPYCTSSAFWPSIDFFERALDFSRGEPPEARLDKLEAMLVEAYGLALDDVRFIASILSIPCEARYGASTLTPQKQKDETIRVLVDMLHAAAAREPTLVLLEDLHWADPTTLEVLDLLVGHVRTSRLLVVLSFRPEFRPRWTEHGHVTAITLPKLVRARSAAVVAHLTGGRALPGDLLEQILARTDGVPLFVEELTKSILESGELRQVGNSYEYTPGTQVIAIPATLRDSLMARLDRSAAAKEVAQVGAVIGREFSFELLELIMPKPKGELLQALRQLTDSGLLFARGNPPDASYMFKHALILDIAYDSLLKSRRQQLHARIAAAIEQRLPGVMDTEPEVMARHLSIAGQSRAAMGLWRRAAELAMRRMTLVESITHLNKALAELELLPPEPGRDQMELELHASLGTVFMLSKGWAAPEVEKAYKRANELSASLENADDSARALWGICVFHLVRGELAHAREIGERLMVLADAIGTRRAQLVAHMLEVQLAMYSGRFDQVDRHWATTERLYSETEDRALIGHYSTDLRLTVRLHGAHVLWIMGLPDQAVRLCVEKDGIARSLAHPYSLSWSLTWGAMPHLYRGDYEALEKSVDEGIRIAREHGLAYTQAIGRVSHGWLLGQRGQPVQGIEEMRAGLAAFRATGAEIAVPFFKTLLAELLGCTGATEEAHKLLDQALDQVEQWGERWQEAEIHRVRGLLWANAAGLDDARAEESFLRAIHVASAQRARGWELRARTALAALLQRQGHNAQARSTLGPIVKGFQEGAQTKDLLEARALLNAL
jgi:predicted ATPase